MVDRVAQGDGEDRRPALERRTVFAGRGARVRIDLDVEEDVPLADDAGRRERPVPQWPHRRRVDREAELLVDLACRGRRRVLPRLDQAGAALPAPASPAGQTRPAGSSQSEPSWAGGTGRRAHGGRSAVRRKTWRTPPSS